jgi:ParB family chromosome partitioning protein
MAKPTKKTRGLGRGLSALMADVDITDQQSTQQTVGVSSLDIGIELLFANPDQPRRDFKPEDLEELATSIKACGIIQPILVRERIANAGTYEIVAGERRWRAAQIAQLHSVPVVVKSFSDQEVLEVAIIENVQRLDLNPIEEALGYDQLMTRFSHTQQEVSDAMGKSRSHIANLLRLLKLPSVIKDMVVDGRLSAGHARALIGVDNSVEIAKQVIKNGLSVRQTESLAKPKPTVANKPKNHATTKAEKDADTKALENELSAHLGMRVSIDFVSEVQGGKMTINFRSLEQLDDLMNALSN